MEFSYKKIEKNEFDKLKRIFPDSEEDWIKYRKKRLNELDNNDIDIYVVINNQEFIGEITVKYSSNNIHEETIPNVRAYFEAFRVDDKYQGRGLGQKLFIYALNDLEKRGYTEFTIGVEDDNDIAKHIYFKLGFTNLIARGKGDRYAPSGYNLYLKK